MNIQTLWYQKNFLSYLLWPFSAVYQGFVAFRHCLYRWGVKKTTYFPVPVIVVGNLTVGGVGKTPLVISLANALKQQGWRPGLVSRGYGGSAIRSPQAVQANSDPRLIGDEAVLIVQKTACPLVVCKKRVKAVARLLQNNNCNIVISDDGLQHLALGRQIEIAVIDGERRFGNGFCLPAGPLREPIQRLKTVDLKITNGVAEAGEWSMHLVPGEIYQLMNPSRRLTVDDWAGKTIHAVAGIGHPQRFFNTLENLGLKIRAHPFPDHYFFQKSDLDFGQNTIVVMTEKDAIKCHTLIDERHWCLPVHAKLSPEIPKIIESLSLLF